MKKQQQQQQKTGLAAIYQRYKELNHKKTAMQVYSGAEALEIRGCTEKFTTNKPTRVGFPDGTPVKNPPANARDAGDPGLISELGQCSGVGNGNPLQYSCLEKFMDSGAWQATLHEVTKSLGQLSTAGRKG